MLYAIDNEEFLDMNPPPDGVTEILEVIDQPGVDGTGFYQLGLHGTTSMIRTVVDAATKEDAIYTFARYAQLVGKEAVELIYLGVSLSAYNVLYKVLNVKPLFIGGLAGGVGGINPPSCGWVEAEWTLKPVPIL